MLFLLFKKFFHKIKSKPNNRKEYATNATTPTLRNIETATYYFFKVVESIFLNALLHIVKSILVK